MDKLYSVQSFNEYVNSALLQSVGEVSIKGEISGYRMPFEKRYTFFDLKDEKSVLSCYITVSKMDFPLEDGQEVIITGTPTVYVPNGRLSLTVKSVQLTGDGAMMKAFEELKKKLSAEGLFEPIHKKKLPRFPARIGLITSAEGAAIHDIQKTINSRWGGLQIFLLPVRVQGKEAPEDLVQALEHFNQRFPVDVIIFGRGGGSLEDLQAFNSERVARAIFSSRIPIVAGIGHEHNVSIADLVADVRAATPTMAATLAIPERDHVIRHIELIKQQMFQRVGSRLIEHRQAIRSYIHRLQFVVISRLKEVSLLISRFKTTKKQYLQKIILLRQQIMTSRHRLTTQAKEQLQQKKLYLTEKRKLLSVLNPQAILERGYSITYAADTDKPLVRLADLPTNGKIRTQIQDGEFESNVTPNQNQPKLF